MWDVLSDGRGRRGSPDALFASAGFSIAGKKKRETQMTDVLDDVDTIGTVGSADNRHAV